MDWVSRCRRSVLFAIGIVCAFACLPPGGGGCQANAADDGARSKPARVDELFAPVMDGGAPGASVIVIQSGEVVHEKGYGLASVELGVPNTPDTVFRLASVTKQFTAMGIMQLHDRGLLDIDDAVGKHLPETPHGDEITIRHLLTHTSGVGGSDEGDLEFAPGERMNYSNQGYMLLGRIIEKVSGMSYEDYLKQNIFLPLSMHSTGYEHRNAVVKGRASGYSAAEGGGYLNTGWEDVSGAYAAGALYSTVRDMRLWDQALCTDKLVRPETLEQVFSPGRLNDGRETAFGFGWMIGRYRGLRELSHGGDIGGFNSWISRFPDQQFTVVVLSNVGMRPAAPLPHAQNLARGIADIYLSDVMGPVEETVPVEAVDVDPAIYDAYAGRYQLRGAAEVLAVMGEVLTVVREGDALFAQTEMGKAALCPLSPTTFFVKEETGIRVTFVKDEGDEVTGLLIDMMGVREMRGEKLED